MVNASHIKDLIRKGLSQSLNISTKNQRNRSVINLPLIIKLNLPKTKNLSTKVDLLNQPIKI